MNGRERPSAVCRRLRKNGEDGERQKDAGALAFVAFTQSLGLVTHYLLQLSVGVSHTTVLFGVAYATLFAE